MGNEEEGPKWESGRFTQNFSKNILGIGLLINAKMNPEVMWYESAKRILVDQNVTQWKVLVSMDRNLRFP
jgi:hypothetical protein